uniref:hypothetical protein n=1 Tax=uncultured Sphingomonas sp. TaxID=158754 RepID=UPI003747E67D
MVAIFTGTGFGAERGSGAVLGGAGVLGSGSAGRSGQQVLLNAATGNLIVSQRDEFLTGRGPDAIADRTYNSLGDLSDDNGDNWYQSTHRRLVDLIGSPNGAGSSIKRRGGDGSLVTYNWDGSGYVSTEGAGAYDRITYNGEWRWTDGDTGTVEVYNGPGTRISQVIDTSGNAVTFSYSGNQLSELTTANGEKISYSWSGANLVQLSVLTSQGTQTRTRYGYDGYGRLETVSVDITPADNSVADGNRYLTTYSYHGASKLVASITETDGTRLDVGYDGANRVTSLTQTVASGVTRTTGIAYSSGQTVVTDALGQTTTLNYDGAGQLTSIVAPPPSSGQPSHQVSFAYNGNGDVTSSTTAAGTTTYAYDSRGNLLQTTDPTGISTWRRYNAANQLTVEMREGSGGVGDYQSTRYVYDAQNRLRFTIDAAGGVTEYGVESHGQPIWIRRFTASAYDLSGWSWDAVPDLDTTIGWAWPADRTGSEFTALLYDERLNLRERVTYGRSDERGVVSVSDGYRHDYLTYDSAGRLLSQRTAGTNAETYVYDGMGRLTSSVTHDGATSIVFNDTNSQTVVTLASGLVQTSTYNRAGELISLSESGSGVTSGQTTYVYDALGRIRKTSDPTGVDSYTIHDRVGRKVADISETGSITEYQYDGADRLIATIRYATKLNASQLAAAQDVATSPDITSLRPPVNSDDIVSWTVYDAAGRVIRSIAGDGSVTAFEYDRSDRLIRTTQYDTKLSSGMMWMFRWSPPGPWFSPSASGNDATARTFYDRAGRVAATLDGEGWLTRFTYNNAGRKIAETAFYTATDPNLRASGSLSQLVASVGTHAKDATSRWIYDGQGKVRYTVDALNRVTEHKPQYDTPESYWPWSAYGPERVTSQYAGSIATLGSYTVDSIRQALADAGLTGHVDNRTRYDVYDDGNVRLAYSVEANGTVTGYRYDTMGRVVRRIQYADFRPTSWLPKFDTMETWAAGAADNPDNRIERFYYSARGELQYSIDAEGYVTGNDYDAAGRLTLTRRWANAVSAQDGWTAATVFNSVYGDFAATSHAYDPDGRLSRVTDASGRTRDLQYHANGALAWEIHAIGTADESLTFYTYDASGRLANEYRAYGTAEQAQTRYGYDGRGNLTSITDANYHTTSRSYDRANQLIGETSALGLTTTYTYDALGNRTRVIDARGNATYSYYDVLGRVIAVRDAENYITQTTYTVFGEVASVTRKADPYYAGSGFDWPTPAPNSGDATTSFEYDRLGRLTKTTDAEGFIERRGYNALGDVAWITNKAGGTTDFFYTRRGLLQSERVAGEVFDANAQSAVATSYVKVRYAYDSRGNIVAKYDGYGTPAQRLTTYAYDKADRLTSKSIAGVPIVDANDFATLTTTTATESYVYDARGNLIQVTDANGARTLSYYDDQNRKIAEVGPTGTLSQYVYDAVGNVVRSRTWGTAVMLPSSPGGAAPTAPWGESRETLYTYDALNRMTSSSVENVRSGQWNGSSFALTYGAVTTSYQYDAMGNVVSVTDGNGITSYSFYDKLGQRVRSVDGEGYVTARLYDAQGNVWHERRWRDKALWAGPGGVGEAAVTDDDRGTNFNYDRNGRRVAEHRFGVASYGVDANGTLYNGGLTASIFYQYNGLGEVTRKIEATGESTDFTYDLSGRMIAEKRAAFVDADSNPVQPLLTYRYDALGNLVQTIQSAQSGGAERVTRNTYDAAGRLATSIDASGASTQYYYDAAGNLLRQSYERTRANDSTVLEGVLYTRDAAGRVVSQTIAQWNGSVWLRGDRQDTQYNAYGEVAQRGINGGWQEQFAYDAAGRLWRSNAGDGVWRFFVHDKAGNRTLTLESEGTWFGGQSLDAMLSHATQGWSQSVGASYIDGLNATIAVYDRRNQQTQTRQTQRQLSEGGGMQDLVSSRSYTSFGEVASETDARGYTTTYTYNAMGRLIRTVRPQVAVTAENGTSTYAAPTENLYYDLSGRLVGSSDANGNVTRRMLLPGTGYGGKDALVFREWHADGGVVTNAYDRFGDLRRTVDAVSRATTMSYDAMGRLTQVTRPSGGADYYAYDTLGQRIVHWTSYYGASVQEVTRYDQQGRVTRQTNLAGETTEFNYEWSSAAASGLGAAGGGWRQVTILPNSRWSSETTDVFGHVIATSDFSGTTTTLSYDHAGRMVGRSGADTMAYTWLNTGLLASMTRAQGDEASASYTGQDWSRERTSYGYSATGQKTRETYTRDGGTWSGGYYQTYAETISDGNAGYDALGRMTNWSQSGRSPFAAVSYSYDAVGNVRRTYASHAMLDQNGNASGNVTQDQWQRYDAMNRVVTHKGTLLDGQIVRGTSGIDYMYNAAGERVQATRTVSRTLQVQEPYGYDPYLTGQPQYFAAPYDAEMREHFAYAADGQLSSVSIAESSASDNGDGTVTVRPPSTMALKASYSYDGLGRLIRQQDWAWNGSGVAYDRRVTLNRLGQATYEVVDQRQGNDTIQTVTSTDYGSGASWAMGQPVTLTTSNWRGGQYQGQSTTTNAYAWYGGAVTSQISHTTAQGQAYNSYYGYGAGGVLNAVTVADGRPHSI